MTHVFVKLLICWVLGIAYWAWVLYSQCRDAAQDDPSAWGGFGLMLVYFVPPIGIFFGTLAAMVWQLTEWLWGRFVA